MKEAIPSVNNILMVINSVPFMIYIGLNVIVTIFTMFITNSPKGGIFVILFSLTYISFVIFWAYFNVLQSYGFMFFYMGASIVYMFVKTVFYFWEE